MITIRSAWLALSLAVSCCFAAGPAGQELLIELGPEQKVAPGVPWPYLAQTKEGTTVLFGHVRWPEGGRYPIHYLSRSFDGRKTWKEWTPEARHGRGPITEGASVQLRDGRFVFFDVHADSLGDQTYGANFWVSKDGLRTVEGPFPFRMKLPQIEDRSFDDRGEPVSRVYFRRSVIELPGGDLLASAYSFFKEDQAANEYQPTMRKARSFLLRSRDGGTTWEYVSTIAAGPVGQEGFVEPAVVRIEKGPRKGRLVCAMRTGRETAIWQTESDDDGKTWAKPHPLLWTYSAFGRQRELVGADPDIIEMDDGVLAMAFGHKPDYQDDGNFLAFSLDSGENWTQVTRLSCSPTMAYCGLRQVGPGELYVVYTGGSPPQGTSSKRLPGYATRANLVYDTVGRHIRIHRTR